MKFELIVATFLLVIGTCQCEVFTSNEQMKMIVLPKHAQLVNILREHVEKARDPTLERLFADFEALAKHAKENETRFMSNPINAFLIVKQMTVDLELFSDALAKTTSQSVTFLQKQIENLRTETTINLFPSMVDYNETILALNTLLDVYNLNATQVANGELSAEYPAARPLSLFECYELARVSFERKFYYHALVWLQVIFDRLAVDSSPNEKVDLFQLNTLLAISSGKQGNLNFAINLINEMLAKRENDSGENRRLKRALKRFQKKKQETNSSVADTATDRKTLRNENSRSTTNHNAQYWSLCRDDDEHHQAFKNSSSLHCRYFKGVNNNDPFLRIGPAKVEQLHREPNIYLFHDVLTNGQVKILRHMAMSQLETARAAHKNGTVVYRVGKVGWLWDHMHAKLPYLRRFVESLTNLNLTGASEPWQVANYGIGGQFDPHCDFNQGILPLIGQRFATWLFYLDEPISGGSTVFPNIGLRSRPKRRGAILWYNLLTSNSGDWDTLHASCPVLLGSKWISNKWIHEFGQELQVPCWNRQNNKHFSLTENF